jgi:hypothetical protein
MAGETNSSKEVEGAENGTNMLFSLLLGVLGFTISIVFLWILAAPRDPGGIVCRDSYPLRTFVTMLRGQEEIGCEHYDRPIQERPMWERYGR